ncbi:apolipoprotein N-acyltransferase [Biformimicrobium ophioploci]|uniref:Apolipoprotein N-acyltransferase n=1 Tax=Biformimicrobium ophioploci TaxID=3036711 RepID=A0ABQ6LWN3_9GAMM|nr:apolipoprotein N-acyltransferase [Microbulbifer sp. NKW57]GMG86507.1 apolipoprotein N-acyltransferase [Microbulbifer sp. NKW57]
MKLLIKPVLAAIAGALLTLTLAPFDYWPLGLIALALFAGLLASETDWGGRHKPLSGRRAFWLAFAAGIGLFGTGATWVYVSITGFGGASPALGVLLSGLFVLILAAMLATPYYLLGRWFSATPLAFLLAFPACWFLGEWLRSWLFSGFPWLFSGYAHLDTPLAGWAPLASVFGIGFILAFSAAALALAVHWLRQRDYRQPAIALAAAAVLWIGGAALKQVDWTEATGEPVSIGLVQANIPQEKKWLPEFRGETIRRYGTATETLLAQDVDLVVWPEVALPMLFSQSKTLTQQLQKMAEEKNADIISGILFDRIEDGRRIIHNSAAVFGRTPHVYHKRQLVPFGEYVPLEDILRGLIEFFNLPTSFIRPGPEGQAPLRAAGIDWGTYICYEIVYPDLVAASAANTDALLTISNDAWFGSSIGPLQHMQMARMRALETGRNLVRATNTGLTAFVDYRGNVVAELPQFEQHTLVASIEGRRGITPFMATGSTLLLGLALAFLALARGASVRRATMQAPLRNPA